MYIHFIFDYASTEYFITWILMMEKLPLSVIVLAYNEEDNLPDCLKSASFAAEIILVDSGSTDKSDDIAKSFGCKILQRPLNGDYAAQRNFAIAHASNEWVMMLDADERITSELAEEIKEAVLSNQDFCWRISRENHFVEGKVLHGVLRPDKVERLFKKSSAKYEGSVHERLQCPFPKKELQGRLIHFPYKSWEIHLDKMNRYTTMLAQKYAAQGKNSNFLSGIMIKPLWAFLKTYVVHLGFLDGKLGFEFCLLHGFYTLEKYIKLRSINRFNGRI
ncbi:MAG TPA: beta-1,4-glucosyltransferase [Succinivibrionaceae bacterium]|nr:beta-1,4-glucosyltransferase [Succinivibrionaceae bacterium]